MAHPPSHSVLQQDASVPVFQLYGEHEHWLTPDMVHCETIAERSVLHNWQIRPHQHHGLFQILYLKAGKARMRIDDDEFDMRAGHVALVPQMCIHGFRFAQNAQGHVLTLAYPLVERRGGDAGATLLALRRPHLHRLPASEEGAGVQAHFSAIDREYRSVAVHRELVLESLLAVLLAWLARQIAPPGMQALQATRGARHFSEFCKLIETAYARQHPVAWYAGRLGITAAHLNALCRKTAGQSALELVHERLVLEARRNLVYTSMSVSQVSYALGFADPAYFTRFFKRRTGLSPRAFRARASAALAA